MYNYVYSKRERKTLVRFMAGHGTLKQMDEPTFSSRAQCIKEGCINEGQACNAAPLKVYLGTHGNMSGLDSAREVATG